jgi:hypothetical protein
LVAATEKGDEVARAVRVYMMAKLISTLPTDIYRKVASKSPVLLRETVI